MNLGQFHCVIMFIKSRLRSWLRVKKILRSQFLGAIWFSCWQADFLSHRVDPRGSSQRAKRIFPTLPVIKSKNHPAMVLKLDLSKASDRTNWLYLRLMILYVGISLPVVKWIMGCIPSVSFAVLINGSASNFFRPSRGLRHGRSLSPLLFFLEV